MSEPPPAGRSWTPRLIAPLVWMVALLWLGSRPWPPAVPAGGDKLIHAVAYGLLAALWVFALAPRFDRNRSALLALSFTAGWGGFDELQQAFVPGRHSSLADWCADLLGAVLAVAALRRFAAGERG